MSETTATHTGSIARVTAGQEIPERMRADVRVLGELLGRVLRESGSPGLYEDVERLRTATIEAYTDESGEAFERAAAIADELPEARAEEVARAFTVYFHLANLAEEHQRVRVLRDRARKPADDSRTDTVPGAYAQLADELGEESARERLQSLRFHPVFTAHPTEARRRAVSDSIRRLAGLLDDLDGGGSGAAVEGAEGARIRRSMLEEVDTLWRTAPLRSEKPTPVDEARSVMAAFDETLYTAVPEVYRRIEAILHGDEAGAVPPVVRPFVRVGTWVGGDRDGNPFVTAKISRTVARIASEHVLLGLERSAQRIGRSLTLHAGTTPASAALQQLFQRMADVDAAAPEILERSPGEVHRAAVLLIARRIGATRTRDADLAYREPAELLADLRTVQDSLAAAGARRQAFGGLQELVWQVETFGFHLAELEVRQHSAVHVKVLEEIEAGGELSEQAEEALETVRAIAHIQARFGPSAAGRYIVSFTQSAEDLANVHRLARAAVGPEGTPPVLDVVPLFETFADLQAAPAILAEIVQHPAFAERLAATGRKLEVMLGYSDSSK
ncbi:MAG: phosphoenolpyruvate carboxylase, partial [Microbacteriaceae bacterium]